MPSFLFTPSPNKDAVRFLRDKAPVAREVFDGLLPELRGLAFTITGVENLAVLKKARERLAGLPAGGDWDDIKKGLAADLVPYLGEEGGVKRAELLLRVHGYGAYSAAQYQVMDRQRDVFPYWQYQAAGDEKVRASHAALDGLIFPASSDFWKTHFPPWEFGCRCQVVPLSEDDVDEIRAEDAKKVPQARRVLEGERLKLAETQGTLVTTSGGPNGIPAQVDVRSPREKSGGSGFYHNPGDLHVDLDALRATYSKTPEGTAAFGVFEQWAKQQKLGKGKGTVWEWIERALPSAVPADGWPALGSLKEIKRLGGSTGATLVEDTQGNRYVLKRGNSPEHIREEVAADELYRAAGLNVPAAKLYTDTQGRPVKLAAFVEGETLGAYLKRATPEQAADILAEARKGFATDALLGNYDVVGMDLDNMLVGKDGALWRIDNGGSLRFRAQGARKDAWGAEVTELATLRDPKINRQTASVFGAITEAEIGTQARALAAKRAALLAATPADLRDLLAARLADLERRFPLSTSGFTPEFAEQVTRARILGKSHLGDADKVEDLQVLFYTEKRNGQDYTVARFKLTAAGGEAVRDKHPELKKLKPFSDAYWARVEPAIKTIATHAADGKYNPAKVGVLQAIKADLAKEKDAGAKAYYEAIVAELEAAMREKRAPALLKAYTPPPTKLEAKRADLTLAKSPWAYVAKSRRRGYAEATGQQIYEVSSALSAQHAQSGAEIRAILPDDKDVPFALRGIVEIAVPGRGGLDAIEKAAQAAESLGVPVAPASPARRELTYLARNLNVLHRIMDPKDRAAWQAIVQDESTPELARLDRLRVFVKDKLGHDPAPAKDAAEGRENAFGFGWRHWERLDLPRPKVEKAMADYTLHHHFHSSMPDVIDSWLNGGGQITPTVERLRTGVSISSGMSPSTDLGTGGANYFFTRIKPKTDASRSPGITFKIGNLARLDAVSYDSDYYGDVRPKGEAVKFGKDEDPRDYRGVTPTHWIRHAQNGSNETLFKNGFHLLEDVDSVVCASKAERTRVLAVFKSHGYDTLPDGRLIEDVVRVKG